jgi:hypothetical protein
MVQKSKRKRSKPDLKVYVAYLVWEFDPANRTLEEYEFPTEAERDAFLFGIAEAEPANEWHESFTNLADAQTYVDEMNQA